MTDEELVKRLVDWSEHDEGKINDARQEAANRIEALTAERDAWKEQHAAEALGLHVQMQRAEAAEAKLAKAVKALRGLMRHLPDYADTVWQDACETLAEIKGEKG
jgi:hypothetical protein